MSERVKNGSLKNGSNVHWFTRAESVLLCKYACWRCAFLLYCSECKRFECRLDRSHEVPVKVCSFRKDAKFVQVKG